MIRKTLSLQAGWLLALATAVAVPGCASMQERQTAAETRTAALEAQVADLQAAQQNIISRLTQLRADIESALDPMRTQQADRGELLRAAESDLSALRQQVLILTDRLDRLTDRIAMLEGTEPLPPAGGGALPPAGGAEEVSGAAGRSEADEIFENALLDYMAGNYVLAIDGFQEYLSRLPDSTQAPQALYWIAESLSAQDQPEAARSRFLEIVTRFPDDDRVPDAKLRAALASIELGRRAEAINELRQLIADHPGTDALLVGCMQLEQLGEALPAGCRVHLP